MRSPIPEALLKMFYFFVLRDHFAQVLGRDDFHIFKPSTRRENWYGFDQSYFTSAETTVIVATTIRDYIHNRFAQQPFFLRAYFLRFKVVEKLARRSKTTPLGWTAPYYRSELSLEPNKEAGISQHETLMRASSIGGATASYVCPMIFDEDAVRGRPQFSDLRMVDISTAPSGWTTNENHHICFQDTDSTPSWCSDPVEGKLIEFDTFVNSSASLSIDEFDLYVARLLQVLTPKREIDIKENPLPMSMFVIATPSEG